MKDLVLWIRGALLLPVLFALGGQGLAMDDVLEARIARLVLQNECAGQTSCLTSWNKGEEFASLGLGHFIWYPAGTRSKPYRESFPGLLAYLEAHGVLMPDWLQGAEGCPWADRNSFVADQNTPRMKWLRGMLIDTMGLQSTFMQQRLEQALPEMLAATPPNIHAHIMQQYQRVAASPMGAYALTDYVNFKGEGVSSGERYKGRGWGLLQVLTAMHGEGSGLAAIEEFVRAADVLLSLRVANSPPARHEARWLEGWRKRLNTYVSEADGAMRRDRDAYRP